MASALIRGSQGMVMVLDIEAVIRQDLPKKSWREEVPYVSAT